MIDILEKKVCLGHFQGLYLMRLIARVSVNCLNSMGSSDSSCCGHNNSQKYFDIDSKTQGIKKQRNKVKRNNTSKNQQRTPASNSSHNTSTKLQPQQNDMKRDPEQTNKCAATDVKHCETINRMMKALQEYESISNNIESKQTYLVKYFEEIYEGHFINDWFHIINDHDDDIEEIYNYISSELSCNIMECAKYKRWNRIRGNESGDDGDVEFRVYRDLLDQIHCYILHSFDIGTRAPRAELQRQRKGNNEMGNTAIHKFVDENREFCKKIDVEYDRFASGKYTICF